MAPTIAPYHNGMRLGQGFNSYTQQICLDRAVLEDTPANRAVVESKYTEKFNPKDIGSGKMLDPSAGASQQDSNVPPKDADIGLRPQWTKPQIVSYTSKFVDKLSDVTDSMNISGALSVKYGGIGGKASGSYVDSDKFKESDVNFHMQVKVVNQVVHAPEFSLFNKINNVSGSDFAAVYGDSFISGFEEGGELNAIVSIKVSDKAKIFEIKASLEAEMNMGALSGSVKADFAMAKNNLSKSTETTVAVSWSGGGSIKDPGETWTIESITAAASAFPDLVAICPQRTNAILTKYTSLESFQRQKANFTMLDYENAGIYTNSLLDHYMDYKLLWKQLAMATYELENNRATIQWSSISEEMAQLAKVRKLPSNQVGQRLRQSLEDASSDAKGKIQLAIANAGFDEAKTSDAIKALYAPDFTGVVDEIDDVKDWEQNPPFTPTFAGLIKARKLCRVEMAKIVNEVDLVTKNPKFAADPQRDQYRLHPLVFKQLLPVMRAWSADMLTGGTQVSAPLILGYSPPPPLSDGSIAPLCQYSGCTEKSVHSDWIASVEQLKPKARNYRMVGAAGRVEAQVVGATRVVATGSRFFSDLPVLDPTDRPVEFAVWQSNGLLNGIRVRYANGEVIKHGDCKPDGIPTKVLTLRSDGSEHVFEVSIDTAKNDKGDVVITAMYLATTLFNVLDASTPLPNGCTDAKTVTFGRPDDHERWTLRGFFGFEDEKKVTGLGVIYGKDAFVPVPTDLMILPLTRKWRELDDPMQLNIKKTLIRQRDFAGKLLMGKWSTYSRPQATIRQFNALDRIELDWKIKSIAFANVSDVLSGLRVMYTNGAIIDHGVWDETKKRWEAKFDHDIISCCIRRGRVGSNESTRVQTVEFVLGTQDGGLPDWPLELATQRWTGTENSGGSVLVQSQTVVEAAPRLDRARWSLKGFFGWIAEDTSKSTTEIVGLGLIWGQEYKSPTQR